MSLLAIRGLSVAFPHEETTLQVLDDLSLDVNAREIFVLLGESGCGKTTLLRTIGGFQKADSGEILLDGRNVDAPSIDRMMIFQSFDQLFPWFTLRENLLYALKKTGTSPSDAEALTKSALEDTGLSGFENHYPAALSGGMKQRGAIARALAVRSGLLLMDEPFSSLDYATRQRLYPLLRELNKTRGTTVLLVTHDIEEALALGTRIAVFDAASHRIGTVFDRDDCDAARLQEALSGRNKAGDDGT